MEFGYSRERRHFPVIAVGGGPAGIALAIECIQMGMKAEDVLILEKGEVIIKAIQQFYPEKKMTLANYKNLPTATQGHLPAFPDLTKAETIVYFQDLINKNSLNYRLHSDVSKVQPIAGGGFRLIVNQEEYTADRVAIGIGILGRPNKPEYKLPLKLRDQLHFDLTSQPIKNAKVLVIGGGDTSSEYCQVLAEENCQLTLAYRQNALTRMMESNLKAVEALVAAGKLKLWLNCDVESIEEVQGRPKINFKSAEYPPAEFDCVVFAIGGTTPVNFLKLAGVEFGEKDWPKYNESGETNVPGLYLTGDLVAGRTGGSIITAYNSCFRTAQRILAQQKATHARSAPQSR